MTAAQTPSASAHSSQAAPVDALLTLVEPAMQATDDMIHARMMSAVTLIPDLSRHLIDSGGKRLRPMLTLAAAQACQYRGDAHIKLAAAVEFIHTATLLHDDVVDASGLRRGKASANVVWGNKPPILVGDFLFSRAFQLMVETGDLAVLAILSRASAVIAEGEVMQLRSSNNLATSEADYLAVVTAKTAELFAASAEAGAAVAGAPAAQVAAWRDYGHNLGIAFQLIDDTLDYSGRGDQMGKAVGDDFREAKVTLPVILAYARADATARSFWRRVIEDGQQVEADLATAIGYIESTGALADSHARARAYADKAIAAAAHVPDAAIRAALTDIAEFCVARAY